MVSSLLTLGTSKMPDIAWRENILATCVSRLLFLLDMHVRASKTACTYITINIGVFQFRKRLHCFLKFNKSCHKTPSKIGWHGFQGSSMKIYIENPKIYFPFKKLYRSHQWSEFFMKMHPSSHQKIMPTIFITLNTNTLAMTFYVNI
jgi:hypothetical protein